MLKGSSFTANAGTKAADLPKAGLPPQTQEQRLTVSPGMNRCGNSPFLYAPPPLSLASEQTLKDLERERSQGTIVEVRRVHLVILYILGLY